MEANKKPRLEKAVPEVNPIVMLYDVREKLLAAQVRQNTGMAAEARANPALTYNEPFVMAKRGRVGAQEVNICLVIAPANEDIESLKDSEFISTCPTPEIIYHNPAEHIPWEKLHYCIDCDTNWTLDELDEPAGYCKKCKSAQILTREVDPETNERVAHCVHCGTKCEEADATAGQCINCCKIALTPNNVPEKGPTSYCECCGDICEMKRVARMEDDGYLHQRYFCAGCGEEPEKLIDPTEMAN